MKNLVVSLLLVLGLAAGVARAVPGYGGFYVGLDRFRPGFSIDHHGAVLGVPVHFFTGRPREYLGWNFTISRCNPLAAGWVGSGFVVGTGFLQTRYWLNWEAPQSGVSLPPFGGGLSCWYVDAGPLLYARLGPLQLTPFATVPLGFSSFSISDGENEESGAAFYFGLAVGGEARIYAGRDFAFAAGWRRTYLTNASPEYEVEEGVTLRGRFRQQPEELYVGVVFGWTDEEEPPKPRHKWPGKDEKGEY